MHTNEVTRQPVWHFWVSAQEKMNLEKCLKPKKVKLLTHTLVKWGPEEG